MKLFFFAILFPILSALIATPANRVLGQSISGFERGRAKDILNAVKNEIKDGYYDVTFQGVDLEAKFKAASEKLNSATSIGQAYSIIAQAVMELNDSHTRFYPPPRAGISDYGWRMQIIGDKCLVTHVKKKSDAAKQGLKPGDEILKIEGNIPNRRDLWKMQYYYNILSPRQGLNVLVKSPGSETSREMNLAAKLTPKQVMLEIKDAIRDSDILYGKSVIKNEIVVLGETAIWKMPTFIQDPGVVAGIMKGKVAESKNLIIDLRRNGGGYVVTLEELAGFFVERDTKIADLKGRKEMKPQMAKTKGNNIYKGNLIVILDSNSASASEIFARFMQLQQRGVVIGDQSSGAVMQSRGISMSHGTESIIGYALNLTNADVIMSDGKSIEHIGVTPQLAIVPNGSDLAARRDPVLAAALQLFGSNITPEEAGKLYEPEKDDED